MKKDQDRFEDRVCCICNEHKKFLGSFNAGKKLYCNECEVKINKEYGSNYWKPCSFEEFLQSVSSQHKKSSKPRNMFSSMRETIRQMKEEEDNV